ncbi:MAG: AAA family ATPase [Sterolibacteriaceae bacterium]|uniref:endopeptidase La n=1 Tax=Candidatus Methylophosphatis roskildensis TaxID=2899263 RepID=A0A9D7E1Q0_9PROT|nr:AAA family ATPase [Candidatus Methylophosphatis roskildensis]
MKPLEPQLLSRPCDPALLDFATTAELPDTADGFGQSRAEEAVRFAIDIRRPGYNLFVLGEPGSGRHFAVRRLLEERAAHEPAPGDWCYVNNFDEPQTPRALRMPAGRGAQFERDMQQFVSELGSAISSAFESDEYRSRIEAIQEGFKKREESALRELGQESVEQGVALLRTPQGFAFAPVKNDETLSPDEFQALPDDEQKRIRAAIESFGQKLGKLLHQFPRWRRELQTQMRQASRDTMQLAVGHLIEELAECYADLPEVTEFLEAVRKDVVETGEELRESQKSEADATTITMTGSISLQRYQVNLLVDNADTPAAPIVFEDNPNHQNLVGRVDQVAHMGTLLSNFTLIKAGALHRANGGYLMLDAVKLLTQPYAYEGLKRALKSGHVRIESLGQIVGLISTLSVEPEPIPVELKVVLIGERLHYYLLREFDPEFEELFKVAADFDSDLERNDENTRLYVQLVARLARGNDLRPFAREAVARLIEDAARSSGDAEKLSAHTRRVADLMRESDHWAHKSGRDVVAREDVQRALDARIRRADRIRAQLQREALRETLLIATGGAQVGHINGLAVIDLGDFVFAHPVRITATARLGEGEVIDIEREAELGGALHSKGVMILSSFLAARYSRSIPLSLTASLVFEQSYGPVEGDSASLAELCALLSALAAVPIRQSLAVTGSVNQYGRVQAIGAVNEKIEGFFDLCRARDLDGEQGVLIPDANVKHLMLREDVVQACADGRFGIYAVSTVDEAIALLTGVPAGEPDDSGLVPEGSINYLVAAALAEMSAMRQSYAGTGRSRRRERKKD